MSVLAHQVALLGTPGVPPPPEQKLLNTFDYFIRGCLIPLVVRALPPILLMNVQAAQRDRSHRECTRLQSSPLLR